MKLFVKNFIVAIHQISRSSVFGEPSCFFKPWFVVVGDRHTILMGRKRGVREEEEGVEMTAEEEPNASGCRSLYEVLGNAKDKFQQLQNVMAILGDPEKRELYDQTGSMDAADMAGNVVKSLYMFLRTLFKQVTEEDIDAFSASYRGSKEEEKDLLALYTKLKGGFRKKKNGDSTLELAALINQRGKKQMDSLASALEAKYGKKGKGTKGRKSSKPMEEPSEEEFLAAQQRVIKQYTKSVEEPSEGKKLAIQNRANKKRKR